MLGLNSIQFEIQNCGYAGLGPEWSRKIIRLWAQHRFYLPVEGESTVKLKDRIVSLNKGYLYFIPAYTVQETHCENYVKKYWVHFTVTPPYANEILQECTGRIKLSRSQEEEMIRYMKICIDSKNDAQSSGEPETFFRTQGAVRFLIAPFMKNVRSEYEKHEKFAVIINYISSNLNKNITLQQLAGIISLEPNYFSSVFKQHFGLSPKKYILKKKMDLALALLSDTNEKISEVAKAIGIPDSQYFNRMFKSRYGMSPGKFRIKCQEYTFPE